MIFVLNCAFTFGGRGYFHVTQFRLLNALRFTDSRGKLESSFFLNLKQKSFDASMIGRL